MPFSYEQWLQNLFRDLKNRGISAILETDGSVSCHQNGHQSVTTKVAVYSKYREYLEKYPD